jgi:hypothetical protein
MVQDDKPVGLDGLEVKFDDERVVSGAGVMLVAMVAERLGIEVLAGRLVRLRRGRPGSANTGRKVMALIFAMVLGADSIDDADVPRAGRTRRLLGGWLPAPRPRLDASPPRPLALAGRLPRGAGPDPRAPCRLIAAAATSPKRPANCSPTRRNHDCPSTPPKQLLRTTKTAAQGQPTTIFTRTPPINAPPPDSRSPTHPIGGSRLRRSRRETSGVSPRAARQCLLAQLREADRLDP